MIGDSRRVGQRRACSGDGREVVARNTPDARETGCA
jgi:hypothetical protein